MNISAMQIRFLELSREGVFLLGRPLSLSPSEEKLLRAIAEGGKSGRDDLAKLLPSGVGYGNVAVHINAINRKAEKISARKLVICEDKRYKINPFM